jgi:hypothetical protein
MSIVKSSLLKLPGVVKDTYGNLNVVGVKSGSGLRHRYSFVLRLSFKSLAGVVLEELLNWMRWGSMDGVMWECTARELFRVVERWERANPDAPASLYGITEDRELPEWNEFWKTYRAHAESVRSQRRCSCGRFFRTFEFTTCPACDTSYWDGKNELLGPRGPRTYNLALIGGDGHAVAALAYATRGQARPIPENLPISPGLVAV